MPSIQVYAAFAAAITALTIGAHISPADAKGALDTWTTCGNQCAEVDASDDIVQSVAVRPLKGHPLAVATVTDAADLPFGATWQIDGARQIRVPFMHCGNGSCTDQVIVNDDYLSKMRHGSILRIGIHENGGWKTSSIKLAGFGAA